MRAAVVNHNAGRWLRRCVDALLASSVPLEITVVDNASTDGSLDQLEGLPLELIRNRENRGFGAACNQAASGLEGDDLLVFVNPDCEVEPDCLELMATAFAKPAPVGMVGAWVMDEDGSVQKATLRRLPTAGSALKGMLGGAGAASRRPPPEGNPASVDAVSGALVMVSVSCFRSLGGYDEGFFLHCEDLDLMRRASRAGWSILLCRDARAIHAQGISHREAPLRALAHKHASLCRYFSADLGPAAGVFWSALIWCHFVLRAPLVWLAAGRER